MDQRSEDLVVLLDDSGEPTGTAARTTVHGSDTPLHLAFSCYLLDADHRVLITRRALSKRTWPGVWTNSFCGHPRPGEPVPDAVRRYAGYELGTAVTGLRCVLPDFRYRATDAAGVVENEVCPVFVAEVDGAVAPHPDEVAETRWVPLADLRAAAAASPWALSPWLVLQLDAMERTGAWPLVTA
jgi:isopentenyl-diphosphate Delta-isomerase